LEGAAYALGLTVAYRNFSTQNRWKISLSHAKSLCKQCCPFIIIGLMITSHARVDQLMLKQMMGERELGIYAAALQISNVWTVIPSTLITSIAPYIALRKSLDEISYQNSLVALYRIFALIALLVVVFTVIISPYLINLLYGVQYKSAATALRILVLANLFGFIGIAQTLWTINDHVITATLLSTFISSIANIVLTYMLINNFGYQGAAFSVVFTECLSIVIIPCILRRDLLNLYRRAFFPI
ncbi:MAG TPA: oligosaccharide flippase family protein, partial [Syntrophales bacterium]|nr:oligosaccharide flippase family protein [Syntrophales bacterium]